MLVLTAVSVGARTVPRAVGAVAVAAIIPTLVVAARGGSDFAGAVSAASLLAGAGAGFSVDDPAAATLASSPTRLAARRGLRASVVMAVLTASWLTALGVASAAGAAGSITVAGRELVATAAIATAVASRTRADAVGSPGASATAGAILTMTTITALALRWPELPALGGGPTHHRWWWVTVAGLASTAWSARDPAGRGFRR